MCAELNLGPDWFKNAIFPKPDDWAKSAMKSLDQNRINADIAGYPMHEIICAMQRNWGESSPFYRQANLYLVYMFEKVELFQYYTNLVCTGRMSLKDIKKD